MTPDPNKREAFSVMEFCENCQSSDCVCGAFRKRVGTPKSEPLSGVAQYCIVFLWNAGEKIRAIGLTRELSRCDTLKEAREIAEKLAATYGPELRERNRADRELRDRLNKENPSDIPV